MSEPYIGEIRLTGFTFAPQNWAFCNGQSLAIADYDVLFTLIGTTYGGDGVNTFSLPNLQSRAAVHQGVSAQASYVLGQIGGSESVTLTTVQLPGHTHTVGAQTAEGSSSSPQGGVFAESAEAQYAAVPNSTSAPVLTATGGNQSHENRMPYLTLNYIISLFGIYPSQS